MIHSSLAILFAFIRRSDIGGGFDPGYWSLNERSSGLLNEPLSKQKSPRAKETVDLIRMARAFTELDALEAEIEAFEKTGPANRH